MDRIEDIDRYIDEWTRMQIVIWRERIERLKIVRSGALHQSFSDKITDTAEGTTITMKFARYGIYQALGVGYGYKHDNGGDLPFLDNEYRHRNYLDRPRKVGPAWGGYKTSGNPRKRRDWFSAKLYMSVMSMVEDLARITGEEAAVVVCDALSDVRSPLK